MATAANNGAKPQAAKLTGVSAASATDAKQGFAASAADNKADPTQIPDPESFDQNNQKVASGAAAPFAAAPAAVPASTAVVSSTHVNPFVVAGIPLGAAVLLMGVYWLILRAGAV